MTTRKIIGLVLMLPAAMVFAMILATLIFVAYEGYPHFVVGSAISGMFIAGLYFYDTEPAKTATIDMQDELTAPTKFDGKD